MHPKQVRYGSVRYLTDETASVVHTYDYDAFGNLLTETDTPVARDWHGNLVIVPANPMRFAGEQWDPDLGLYYNRARWLDTNSGRFLTTDSWEGDRQAPLTLHKYLYVSADPENRVDPSGHFDVVEMMAAVAISITLFAMASCTARPTLIRVGVDFRNDWDLGRGAADTLTSTEQISLKTAALQTMREAYTGYGVVFSEGPTGSRNIIIDNQLGKGVGETYFPQTVSHIHFWNLWSRLENVLDCTGLTECQKKSGNRDIVVTALGQGVGATSAHELGHQGGLAENCLDPSSYGCPDWVPQSWLST